MAALNLNIDIPDSKVARSKQRILAYRPNTQTIPDPDNENVQIPRYTDKEWIEQNLKEVLRKWDKRGKIKLATESAENTDMFEE